MRPSQEWRQTRLATSCRNFRAALFRIGGTAEDYRARHHQTRKIVMWSCSVIVNASLAGGARLGLQRAAGIFERRWSLSKHQKDHRARPRHSKIIRAVRDCECVRRSGARLGLQRAAGYFERRCFRAGVAPQKIYCRARPRHSKKSCELLQIVKSLAGVAPDSACAAGFLSGVVCARAPQKIYCRARPRHLKKKS
jgi:hypothetical protein